MWNLLAPYLYAVLAAVALAGALRAHVQHAEYICSEAAEGIAICMHFRDRLFLVVSLVFPFVDAGEWALAREWALERHHRCATCSHSKRYLVSSRALGQPWRPAHIATGPFSGASKLRYSPVLLVIMPSAVLSSLSLFILSLLSLNLYRWFAFQKDGSDLFRKRTAFPT